MTENQRTTGHGEPPGTPRWVKVFIIMFITLVLLVIILHLLGFGFGGHDAGDNVGMLFRGLVEYLWALRHNVELI